MIEAGLYDPPQPISITSKVQSAAELALRGFRVFPLTPNAKDPPLFKGWKEKATTDVATIREWWAQWPDANIGVATGRGVFVLDADHKGGKLGLSSLDMLDLLGLPESMRVTTPTGGVHVYLRAPSDGTTIGNSVAALDEYPDIDVRADGGYVVGPGSTIGDAAYVEPVKGLDIDGAPSWLIDLVGGARRKLPAAKNPSPLVDLDTPQSIARATDYLKQHAPIAVSGGGGNNTTFKVATRVRDFGLSQSAALEVMFEDWNEMKDAIRPGNPTSWRRSSPTRTVTPRGRGAAPRPLQISRRL
jgi:hypothetical protein